jgi:hypothetical protein
MDEDGDIPIYSIDSAPATMTLDPKTGKLLWTPTISDIGNHTVTIRVSDSRGSFDNQTFTIEVKQIPSPPVFPPKCAITYPANGSKLRGAIQIEGTAVNGSFPLSLVKIRIDDGTWTVASGLESWTYRLDTSKLAKGSHLVEAKAFAANLSSETASVNFMVDNPPPGVSTGGNPWCLPAVLIIIVTGIALLIFIKKRTKR